MESDDSGSDLSETPGLVARMQKMAHGGEAMGRLDDGRVVFVDGALPDEAVSIVVTESTERYARGVIAELPAEPSRTRVIIPECPHFGAWPDRGHAPESFCGGCQWQHIEYAAQLEHKRDILHDALHRIGGVPEPPVEQTIGMRAPWRYRNRMRLHADGGRLGFISASGEGHCPIEVCPIAHPAALGLLGALDCELPDGFEVDLRVGLGGDDALIGLWGDEEDLAEIEIEARADISLVLVHDGGTELAAGRPFLVQELAGRRFIVPATSFFQVNTEMAEALVQTVRRLLPESIGVLADLHSGVGTFGILLADRAREVFTVESEPASVGAAVENASGLDNITLLEADAAEGLAFISPPPDAVVVDPPRTGLDQRTVRLLSHGSVGTICYVSCEPSTLARDVRQLASAGWELVAALPLDMFPQTFHIESVSLLRRR